MSRPDWATSVFLTRFVLIPQRVGLFPALGSRAPRSVVICADGIFSTPGGHCNLTELGSLNLWSIGPKFAKNSGYHLHPLKVFGLRALPSM
jgi:hypothetical protein